MIPVSVVIPCFRCGAVVGRSFDSVLEQTRPPLEIILVDDGSGDGTGKVLRALQQAGGPRVKILSLERNLGPAGARNAAWAAAAGDYLAFLDVDDVWQPRKLEVQYGWMQAHPDAILSGHVIAAEGAAHVDTSPPRARRITASAMLRSNRFQTSSVMLRRTIPERFTEELRYCEDYALWLDIILRGRPAYYLDVLLAVRFKPVYGAGGLSGRLWRMQAGELRALWRARRAGLLDPPTYLAATAWSCAKFARRVVLSAGWPRQRGLPSEPGSRPSGH